MRTDAHEMVPRPFVLDLLNEKHRYAG